MAGFDYAMKIQGLLANAENEALPDDVRATYRTKAEELMRKYRIAEEEALAVDPGSSSPIVHSLLIKRPDQGQGDITHSYTEIFRIIARHTGVRAHTARTGDWGLMATVVGYEGDVRYTEFLWTAAYLMFSTRIDPTWDPSKSENENIFFLRQAGIERRRIADMAWGNGHEAAARSRVQRIYKQEAARRGEDVLAAGLGFTTATYRQSYADSFVHTLAMRLREARDAADSLGGGLELHGRSERVDEAFYTKFPTLRPDTRPVPAADAWVDPRLACPKCKKAKSGACNDHSYMRPRAWTEADERRAWNREHSTSARAGRASGRSAAEGVTISRTEKAGRLDAANVALEG
jgi:hypothetical protein